MSETIAEKVAAFDQFKEEFLSELMDRLHALNAEEQREIESVRAKYAEERSQLERTLVRYGVALGREASSNVVADKIYKYLGERQGAWIAPATICNDLNISCVMAQVLKEHIGAGRIEHNGAPRRGRMYRVPRVMVTINEDA